MPNGRIFDGLRHDQRHEAGHHDDHRQPANAQKELDDQPLFKEILDEVPHRFALRSVFAPSSVAQAPASTRVPPFASQDRAVRLLRRPRRSSYTQAGADGPSDTIAKRGQSIDRTQQAQFLWRAGADDALQVHVAWSSRRRSRCAFFFAPNGHLHVEAPAGVGIAAVRRVLGANAAWIRRRRAASRNDAHSDVCWFPAEYADGASLLFRGRVLALRLADQVGVHVREEEIVAPSVRTKQHVWAWYDAQAQTLLSAALSGAVELLPWLQDAPRWRHRFMKSRWGSCSSSGRISLNTHLAKLSDALIEYVVVHELCHLRHMHHGPAFYQLMAASLADWKQRRGELRRHGGLLLEPPPSPGQSK